MSEQKRNDQVIAVRSLIKRLLVYGREKRQERENSAGEEEGWSRGTAISQIRKEEPFGEELEAAIRMAECVYDLDGPEDLPDNLELVEFLCAETR